MLAVGRGVEHEVESLGYSADTLQGAPQKRGEIGHFKTHDEGGLGAFVAVVDLLPLVGGLLAGVPVVVIAAIHSVPAGITMLIVFLVYQQVENHVLNPVILSRTVRLNPFWVLLAVLIGATLGGRIGADLGTFVGALIGIPVGGALQVVVREIRKGPVAPSTELTSELP